jgi:tetratricopeptide (TPR) repeat protein
MKSLFSSAAALALAAAVALAAPLLRADSSGESLADHEFRQITQRQVDLLADAAKEGDKLDQEGFQQQVQSLVHDYERFLAANPQYAMGYAGYGYLLWKMDMRKEAIALFLKANQIDPNIALVKNEIGNYLAEEGKPLQAVNYFLAAIKLAPNEPLYHYQLGTLLHEARDDFLKSGEWTADGVDNAMHEAFRRAAELAPDRIEFTHRYAESFYDMPNPDWDAALKVWGKVEDQARTPLERQEVRLQAANVLIKQGKFDAARVLIGTVTEPELLDQRQKLVALMPDTAKK